VKFCPNCGEPVEFINREGPFGTGYYGCPNGKCDSFFEWYPDSVTKGGGRSERPYRYPTYSHYREFHPEEFLADGSLILSERFTRLVDREDGEQG
jgi:hypothetical protein